jgi:hypothetical protein
VIVTSTVAAAARHGPDGTSIEDHGQGLASSLANVTDRLA